MVECLLFQSMQMRDWSNKTDCERHVKHPQSDRADNNPQVPGLGALGQHLGMDRVLDRQNPLLEYKWQHY